MEDDQSISQPNGGVRDLLFSITGTMPESFETANQAATCKLFASGGNLTTNSELKRQSPSVNGSRGEKRPKFAQQSSNRGGICYSSHTDSQSLNEDSSVADAVLSEADVGITEFISHHEGFSGILKQRYSDFIVNEINQNGEIVHLTSTDVPILQTENPYSTNEVLSDILTEDQISRLKLIQEGKLTAEEVVIDADCKETRGKIHHLIKASYPDLDCNTVEKDNVKRIVVRYLTRRGPEQRSRCFTKSTGNYCKFVLYKENNDTQHAISVLAKFLRTAPRCFGYAGTKDRRGKTSQDVTVFRIPPQRLQQLNRSLRNIVLGNFRICKDPLKLGELNGNQFVIVLRNVAGSDEQIEAGMQSLRDVGFINYYGMQRFGTTRISTHSIGRALLQGNWSEAIDLIMKPRECDRPEMLKARETWQQTKDPVKTLEVMKDYHCNERHLLEGLKRCAQGDLVSALSFESSAVLAEKAANHMTVFCTQFSDVCAQIPRNMRLLYVHAYQSYIWNRVVSRRIREFGLRPQPGDLVFKGTIDDSNDLADDVKDDDKMTAGKQDSTQSSSSTDKEPVILTDANAADYDILDVVMPLPGYDVRYPENTSGTWYKEILSEDGMENVDFQNKIKDYSLSGSYRKVIVKPVDLSWEILRYDDYQVPLVQGDLERLANESLPPPVTDGKYKALKLSLSLPPSSYATMAVREVLKCGTSSAFQTTLNVCA